MWTLELSLNSTRVFLVRSWLFCMQLSMLGKFSVHSWSRCGGLKELSEDSVHWRSKSFWHAKRCENKFGSQWTNKECSPLKTSTTTPKLHQKLIKHEQKNVLHSKPRHQLQNCTKNLSNMNKICMQHNQLVVSFLVTNKTQGNNQGRLKRWFVQHLGVLDKVY